jgi:hypothetical protein
MKLLLLLLKHCKLPKPPKIPKIPTIFKKPYGKHKNHDHLK